MRHLMVFALSLFTLFFSVPATAKTGDLRAGTQSAQQQDRDRTRERVPAAGVEFASSAGTASPSDNTVVEGGVEIVAGGAFLSKDKRTVYIDLKFKNATEEDVLAMIVGTESSLIVPNIAETPAIVVTGVNNCIGHGGVVASTWLCQGDEDLRWTKLDPGKRYSVRLSSSFAEPVMATLVDVRLRLLVKAPSKKDEKGTPHDASIVDIEIK